MYSKCCRPPYAPQEQEADFSQKAKAFVNQNQDVCQENVNRQKAAIAIALNAATALAYQINDQSNNNNQNGSATASNSYGLGDLAWQMVNQATDSTPTVSQYAYAQVEQDQHVRQSNLNEHGILVSFGDGASFAASTQDNTQNNNNNQNTSATAANEAFQWAASPASAPPPSVKKSVVVEDTQDKEQEKVNEGEGLKPESLKEFQLDGKTEKKPSIKVAVDMLGKGKRLAFETDDTGAIKINEDLAQFGTLVDTDAATPGAKRGLNIRINQDNDIMEIKADEKGDVYLNGEKIQIETKQE